MNKTRNIKIKVDHILKVNNPIFIEQKIGDEIIQSLCEAYPESKLMKCAMIDFIDIDFIKTIPIGTILIFEEFHRTKYLTKLMDFILDNNDKYPIIIYGIIDNINQIDTVLLNKFIYLT